MTRPAAGTLSAKRIFMPSRSASRYPLLSSLLSRILLSNPKIECERNNPCSIASGCLIAWSARDTTSPRIVDSVISLFHYDDFVPQMHSRWLQCFRSGSRTPSGDLIKWHRVKRIRGKTTLVIRWITRLSKILIWEYSKWYSSSRVIWRNPQEFRTK